MNSDDSRSMGAFSAGACLCAEYGFPIKHDAQDNPPLNLESLKNTVERFAGAHGFSYTMAKSPARRKTVKWFQFTCAQCAARVAPRRASAAKRRRGADAAASADADAAVSVLTDTAIIRSPLVHSVRVRYALGDDPRANLASYALVCEQWAHCCGVAPPDMAAGVAAGTAAPATAQPPAAPVPAPTPVRILQNLIDSRIEHAVYVATTATGGGALAPQPVAVFICPLHVTPAARAALVAETMQALCDDTRTTRIADVRVTAERCKIVDETDALRPLVERVLLRVFL